MSDGKFFDHLNQKILFSPDGNYVWQAGNGIYGLRDGKQLISAEFVDEIIDNGEQHKVLIAGDVQFSADSQYVAVTGQGFYRLSDGRRWIESNARYMRFSPDSIYASTSNGDVFRLSDRQQIFQIAPTYDIINIYFSPDSQYIWADSLYGLNDQAKLFDINSPHGVSFTPNTQYAVILEDGVYRLSDGQRMYDLLKPVSPLTPINYSANSEYMFILSDGIYRISTGERLFELSDDNNPYASPEAIFSPDSSYVAIEFDGVYRLSDKQKLFDITVGLDSDSQFSPDSAYLAVEDAVYHMPDGQKIFNGGKYATFSSSGKYIAFDNDGVYRLSDGQKLFDIREGLRSFTEDENYIYIGINDDYTSIYRIQDGHEYTGLKFLNIPAGIMTIGNTVIIVEAR